MNVSQIRPIDAAMSLYALFQNPDDTQQVFRVLDAFSPTVPESFYSRFERTRGGAALLERRSDILATLRDRERLAAMPDESLGRAYLRFMQRDGLTAEWLVRQSEEVRPRTSGDGPTYVAKRLRDTHDLWHVVTGYGGDLLGEASILAFTYAQTWNPAIGLIASIAYVKAGDPDARRLITDAAARGLVAAWLPAVAWEDLLAEPLDAIRTRLRVGAAPIYDPFHTSDLLQSAA
jgi:ubiquinone biosynthesis protein COQ4